MLPFRLLLSGFRFLPVLNARNHEYVAIPFIIPESRFRKFGFSFLRARQELEKFARLRDDDKARYSLFHFNHPSEEKGDPVRPDA